MSTPAASAPPPPKPLPTILPLDKPFWASTQRHRLSLQRCGRCGTWRYPASPVCADCDSPDYAWTETSGRGEIVSWVVFHRLYFPSFAKDLPYNVALVRLAEGPVMPTNIVDCERAELHSGLAVEVTFEDRAPGISIPMFRPVRGPGATGGTDRPGTD